MWRRGTVVPCPKTAAARPYDETRGPGGQGRTEKAKFFVRLLLTKAALCVVQDAPYSV
jgi:hypothetical protein